MGNIAGALTGASRLALVAGTSRPQVNGHASEGFEYSGPSAYEVAERCGGKVTTTPSGYANCDCPNCDSVGKLGIKDTENGLHVNCFHCQANGEMPVVRAKLEEMFPGENLFGRGKFVAAFIYHWETGKNALKVDRYVDPNGVKFFPQWTWDQWDWVRGVSAELKLPDSRPLFQLLALLAANPADVVYYCEGEGVVLCLMEQGIVATTHSQGATNAHLTNMEPLTARDVVLSPDKDARGYRCMAKRLRVLQPIVRSLRLLMPMPGLELHGDLKDYFENGGTVDELQEIVDALPLLDTAEKVEAQARALEAQAKELELQAKCIPFATVKAALEEAGEQAATKLLGMAGGCAGLSAVEMDQLITAAAKLSNVGKAALKKDYKNALAKAAAPARHKAPLPNDGRATLVVDAQNENNTVRASAGLIKEQLFVRGPAASLLIRVQEIGRAVEVVEGQYEPEVEIDKVRYARDSSVFCRPNETQLRFVLNELTQFHEMDRHGGYKQVACPPFVTRALKEAPTFVGLRSCAGIAHVPLFIGGRVIAESGYNELLKVVVDLPTGLLPVPDHPTRADAEAALKVLRQPFEGYLRYGDNDLLCAIVAATLTAVLRPSLASAPGINVDGNIAGVGKGKFARAQAVIATGHTPALITHGPNPEEFEKRIATAILSGAPAILLDNLKGKIESQTLESGLTEGIATIRLFGVLDHVTVLCSALLQMTSNNAVFSTDMMRRLLPVRIVSEDGKPELRQFDFDPYHRARAMRLELICAVLTIARAWTLAGDREDAKGIGSRVLGSFEQWSTLVCGSTEWLTGRNPIDLIEAKKATDPTHNAKRDLFAALFEYQEGVHDVNKTKHPEWAAGDVAKLLDPDLWHALLRFGTQHPDAAMVGMCLTGMMDAVVDEYTLKFSRSKGGSNRWFVVRNEEVAKQLEKARGPGTI